MKSSFSKKKKRIHKSLTRRNLFNDFEEADEMCPICQNTIVEGTGRLTNCCRNNVHQRCLELWRTTGVNGSECPLCRKKNYGGTTIKSRYSKKRRQKRKTKK
jgi:hypothetical protein